MKKGIWKRMRLLSDPVVWEKEVLYLCGEGGKLRICASAPEDRRMDILFLGRGSTIHARGSPETLADTGTDGEFGELTVFRISERELILEKENELWFQTTTG